MNRFVQPFLKWAGGKSQLLPQFEPLFPPGLKDGSIGTYIEPFMGAGAVFFHVIQHYGIARAHLSDVNPELVLVWRMVKSWVGPLIDTLSGISSRYRSCSDESRERMYYRIRGQYNTARSHIRYRRSGDAEIERAAQLIFLNKTCYNGLFRTNSRGEFNTPFGRYRNPGICDPENLEGASRLLKHASIACTDFSACRPLVDRHAFVYFDPPYRPLSRTSNFTAYSKEPFGDKDQGRLAVFFRSLARHSHAALMLSNSDPMGAVVPDAFFDDLYKGFRITRVHASRHINSKAGLRGRIPEIVVTNYR